MYIYGTTIHDDVSASWVYSRSLLHVHLVKVGLSFPATNVLDCIQFDVMLWMFIITAIDAIEEDFKSEINWSQYN